MKVLIVANRETLDSLKESMSNQTEFKYTEMHKNTYLTKVDSCVDGNTICFGYYYTAIPEQDKRWNGGMVCDLLIEVGSNQMGFLCTNHTVLENPVDADDILDAIHNYQIASGVRKTITDEELEELIPKKGSFVLDEPNDEEEENDA